MSETPLPVVPPLEPVGPEEQKAKEKGLKLIYSCIDDLFIEKTAEMEAAEQKAQKMETQLNETIEKLRAEELKVEALQTETDQLRRQRDAEKRAKEKVIYSNGLKEIELEEVKTEKESTAKNFEEQMSRFRELFKQEKEARKLKEEECDKLEEELRTANDLRRNAESRAEQDKKLLNKKLEATEKYYKNIFQGINATMNPEVPALEISKSLAPESPELLESPELSEQQAPKLPRALLPKFDKGMDEDEVRYDMDRYVMKKMMYSKFDGNNRYFYDPKDTARLPQPVEAIPDVSELNRFQKLTEEKANRRHIDYTEEQDRQRDAGIIRVVEGNVKRGNKRDYKWINGKIEQKRLRLAKESTPGSSNA